MERRRTHHDPRDRQRVYETQGARESERSDQERGEHSRSGLLDTPAVSRIESQWSDIKTRFVDDPRGALDEAFGLLERAFEEISLSLRSDYDRIREGSRDSEVTTEDLRRRLHECRSLLDRLVPPSLH